MHFLNHLYQLILDIKQNIFDDFMRTDFVPESHRFEEAVTRQKSYEETKEAPNL